MIAQEAARDAEDGLLFPKGDADSAKDRIPAAVLRKGKLLQFHATTGKPEVVSAADLDLTTVTSFIASLLDDTDAATARATLGAQAELDLVSQAEAEAGAATTERVWSSERVGQAIAAQSTGAQRAENMAIQALWLTAQNANSAVFASDDIIIDTFENQTGVSAGDSTNELYDSVDEVFGNVAKIGSVSFDGTDKYTGQTNDPIPDGKTGTISFVIDLTGGDGTVLPILNLGGYLIIQRNASNKFAIAGFNSGATQILNISSTTSYTASSGFVHVVASWDLAAGTAHLYVDGVSDLTSTTLTNANIDHTRGSGWEIGDTASGVPAYDLAMMWFDDTYIDLSVGANLAKFFSSGNVIDHGADGTTPTGSCELYCRGDTSTFATDLSGNNTFVLSGSVANGANYVGTEASFTLESTSFTADSAPSSLRVIAEYEDLDAGIVLGTDLNFLASRDGGTTFSGGTEAQIADLGDNIYIATGTIDVSGDPSGTSCRYQITTSEKIRVRKMALQADVGLTV